MQITATLKQRSIGPIGAAAAVAALAGVLAVQALPALPARVFDVAAALVGLVLLRWPKSRLFGCALLGFAWCAWRADHALAERLPRALEGRDFEITGVVDQLPIRREDATRLVLKVDTTTLDGASIEFRGRVRLSWYDDAPLTLDACSRWRLHVRLKRPRGMVNPGGFDPERQALERGINAIGYVRSDARNQRLGAQAWCVDRVRDEISRGIAARVSDPHDAALLQAFSVGDTRGLDEDDWEVARANGIPHLIAISGFHVGVAAAFGAVLVYAFWWLWPRLGLRIAFPIAQAPAALATAVLYGILAGGSLPTVRTLTMIAVVALTRSGRRAVGAPHSLSLALLAILVFDPLATLAAGFWLSFVGVAFLMLCLTRGKRLLGFLRELGVGQFVMTVSLLPLTVWFFGEASLVGALSNLIAVPLISFVIVPLCLLGVLALLAVPIAASPFLIVAASLAHAQWWLLERMATWPGAHWYLPEASTATVLLAMIGAAWLFMPRGVPARWLGLVLFMPLLWPTRVLPSVGAFDATVIDVGQGLSVLLRTAHHAMVFDAGARYPSGFDLGEAAVLPTLHALGVDALDVLMISHGDNDHAGGAASVAKAFPAAIGYAGEPKRTPIKATRCVAGQGWRWDAVSVRVLSPTADSPFAADTSDNDRSCVVLVEGAGSRLLLTGDISSRVEPAVAAAVGASTKPLVLQVPHHGSATSSGDAFLSALNPVLAAVSAGWRNHFGHPNANVVERYRQHGIALLNTATSGAIRIEFPATTPPRVASRERDRQRRYWRE